jgi:phospho-N-acetylmuramoyl-pentapeptide-transferase
MLYWLSHSPTRSAAQRLRYITFRTGGAMITALVFVFLFGPWIIDHLRLQQGKGQPIRSDGRSRTRHQEGHAHHGRADDPVRHRGLDAAVGQSANRYVWIVLGVTLGFGAIGFYDDYLKVTKQTHAGFSGKLAAASSADRGGACYSHLQLGASRSRPRSTFPFFKELVLPLGWFFIVFGASSSSAPAMR